MSDKPHPTDVFVGESLKMRRIVRGLSQTQMANKIGITFQQLQKYESGANRVSASRLFDAAKELEVPIAFFFPGQDAAESRFNPDRANLEMIKAMDRCPIVIRKRVRSLVLGIADAIQ
jgi:transcriptional regulator with XRE-family HTH domain